MEDFFHLLLEPRKTGFGANVINSNELLCDAEIKSVKTFRTAHIRCNLTLRATPDASVGGSHALCYEIM